MVITTSCIYKLQQASSINTGFQYWVLVWNLPWVHQDSHLLLWSQKSESSNCTLLTSKSMGKNSQPDEIFPLQRDNCRKCYVETQNQQILQDEFLSRLLPALDDKYFIEKLWISILKCCHPQVFVYRDVFKNIIIWNLHFVKTQHCFS